MSPSVWYKGKQKGIGEEEYCKVVHGQEYDTTICFLELVTAALYFHSTQLRNARTPYCPSS